MPTGSTNQSRTRAEGREQPQPSSHFWLPDTLCPASFSLSIPRLCCCCLVSLPLEAGVLPDPQSRRTTTSRQPLPSALGPLPRRHRPQQHCLWDAVCESTQGSCSSGTHPGLFSLTCNSAMWPASQHSSLPSPPKSGPCLSTHPGSN